MTTIRWPACVSMALLLAVLSQPARAGTWHEYTDGGGEAGQFIGDAQVPVGVGPLTQIIAADGGDDADLFRISIPNPAAFSATLSAGFTSQLWLFDAGGLGVAYTVDEATPTLTGALLTGPGVYFIGSSRDDYHAQSAGGLIWNTSPPGERAPDGPGAAGPLTAWTGITHSAFEYSTIDLTGAFFVPEPGALLLLASSCVVLFWRRFNPGARPD